MAGWHQQVTVPGEWAEHAECARTRTDMDCETLKPRSARLATLRLVCSRCPVLDECRKWALTSPDPAAGHVAAGLTPAERGRERRGRA